MAISITHYETLYWIAQLGTFRAVAEHFGVSQPTISFRMKEMEKELGIRIFERSGRTLVLTDDGWTVADYAGRILALTQDLNFRVTRIDSLRGNLRFGIPEALAVRYLPHILRKMEAEHPKLKLTLVIENSVVLARRLNEGALDAIVVVRNAPLDGCRTEQVGVHESVWVSGPILLGDAQKAVYTASDLSDHWIMTDPPPSNTYSNIIDLFKKNKLSPSNIYTCNSILSILAIVKYSKCISVFPRFIVENHIKNGSIFEINVEDRIPDENILFCMKKSSTNPGIVVLAEAIRESFSSRGR